MNSIQTNQWSKSSWTKFPIVQQPIYTNISELESELLQIQKLPSIVSPKEVQDLQKEIAQCEQGKKFYLQLGDCAELFSECQNQYIKRKIKFLNLVAKFVEVKTGLPTLKLGRIAGQFAQPRTNEFQIVDGQELYNYKGDNVNSPHQNLRGADPTKLIEGYHHSVLTWNFIKELETKENQSKKEIIESDTINVDEFGQLTDIVKNYARIIQPELLGTVQEPNGIEIEQEAEEGQGDQNMKKIVQEVSQLLPVKIQPQNYITHEGLILNYEEALTREVDSQHVATSAHMLWIGERTRQVNGAHVQFFRGVSNSIGVQISSKMGVDQFINLCQALNPLNEEGKLIIIARFGANNIEHNFQKYVDAKIKENLKLTWVCDPMHGNTYTAGTFKTRSITAIQKQICHFVSILLQKQQIIGGLHIETSTFDVTECLGGNISCITESQLGQCYTTGCDPRLNFWQSFEIIDYFISLYYK